MKFCSYLDAKGIGNATKVLDMGSVKLASALPDPEEVGRAVIKEARCRVLTSEGLLVREEEALMRGPEFSRCHDGVVHC